MWHLFHDIKDELPSLAYDYSDDLTVCSSVVLRLECGNYVFVSDAKVSPRDPSVRLFCGSNVQMMNPLLTEYKTFFRHFFPSKHTLEVYEGFNHSSLDRDGSIHSLLSLYSCIITDRAIKYNLLESQNLHNEIVSSFRRSVDSKELLKFFDTIFLPVEKIRPDALYFVQIFTKVEMLDFKKSKDAAARLAFKSKQQSAEQHVNPSLTDSDDDFEQAPKYSCPDQAGPKQFKIPKFSSLKRADPAVSKRRLDSIKRLASISVNDLSSVIDSTPVTDPGQPTVQISAGVDGEQSVGHDQSSSPSTGVPDQHVNLAQPSGPSTAEVDQDKHVSSQLRVCWGTSENCVVRASRGKTKHYHCSVCDKSHASLCRMNDHVGQCGIRVESSGSNCPDRAESKKVLQAELICVASGTYLVRRCAQGPASPVHVVQNKNGWECTAPLCRDFYNFHNGSLNPGFLCQHVLACVNRNLNVQPDLIDNVLTFDSFGDDDKTLILAFCKTAKDFGLPVIKQYIPTMVDICSTSRYIYYSVFAGDEKPKYYSKLGRVIVTYDRCNKTHKCECGIKSCLHKKIAVLTSETNPLIGESRPEDDSDPNELMFAEAMMQYVLKNKVIPFDVTEFKNHSPKAEFTPIETKCHNCADVDLVTFDVSNRGCIFTMHEKKTGVKVVTKSCPSCSMRYRYAEYSEGYFNFNNSSFFSISLMEVALAAWIKNTSLTAFFEIMTVMTDVKYNIHLLLDAVKAYMALKDLKLDETLNCYRCGHFPVYLTYDVIRSVCFDVKPGEVTNHEYSSSASMHSNCSQYNLSRSYLDKKSPHYNSNVKHFSMKKGQTTDTSTYCQF